MKTSSNFVVCVLAAVALLVCGMAQAATETYDFDHYGLVNGNLEGQAASPGEGNWATFYSWPSAIVANDPTGAGLGKVITTGTGSPGATGCGKALFPSGQTITYTSADTAAEQSLWLYETNPTGASFSATGGLRFVGGVDGVGCFGADAGKFYVRGNGSGYPEYHGSTIEASHWYDVKLTMDFSTAGMLGSLSYRNVTNGDTSFTADAALQGINMGFADDGAGNYVANGIYASIYSNGDGYMDNLFPTTFSRVPEPGTVAMLVCGLIGLLAYAWRKRK